MKDDLKSVFEKAVYIPYDSLSRSIYTAIRERQRRVARARLFVYSFISLLSVGALVPAGRALVQDFSQSGLYQYLSLLFSGDSMVGSYWKEFLFTLADALPVMSIMLVLALLLILAFSVYNVRGRNQTRLFVIN